MKKGTQFDPKDQEVQAAVEGLINLYPRISSMQKSGQASPRREVAIHTKKETVTKAVYANSAMAASPSTTPSLPDSLPRLCNSDILKACLQQHLELATEKPQGNSSLAHMSMIQQTSQSAGSALTTTSLSAEDIGTAPPVAAPLAAGEHAPLSHDIPTTWYELPQWKYWQSLLGDRRHTLADKKETIVTDNFLSDRTRRTGQSVGETWACDKHKQLESVPVTESQLQSTGRRISLTPRRLPSEVEGESETSGSKKLRSETEPSVFWPGGKEQGSPPNVGSATFSRSRRVIERKKRMQKGNHVNRKEEYTLSQGGGEGPSESSSYSRGGHISVGPPPPTSVDIRGQLLQQPGQLPTSPPNLQMLPTADMPLVAYLLQQQMQMQQAHQNFHGVPPLGQTLQQQQQQQNSQQLSLHGTSGPLFQALNLQQQLFLQQQLQFLERARQMPQVESQTQNAVPSVQCPPVLPQQALALNNFPQILSSVMPQAIQPQASHLLAASSGLPTACGDVSSSQILPLNQGSPVQQNFQQILQQQHQLWLLQQQFKLELQQQQQQLQQQQQPRGDGGGIHTGTSMGGRNEGISRAEPQIGMEGSVFQQCPELANNDRQQAYEKWSQFVGKSSYPENLHGGNRVTFGQSFDFSSQPGLTDISTDEGREQQMQAGPSRYKGTPGNQGTRDVILMGRQGNSSSQGTSHATSQQREVNSTQELVQVPIQVCVPDQRGLEWAGKSAVLQARYIDPSQSMPWSSGVILPPGTNLQSQPLQSTNEIPPTCAFPFHSFESKPPKCETGCAMAEAEPKVKDFNTSQESVEEGNGDDDVVISALDTSLRL